MRRRDLVAAVLALPVLGHAQTQPTQREALLMEGKRTLRQRVLTRPAAAYKKVYSPLAEKAAICFEVGAVGAVHTRGEP